MASIVKRLIKKGLIEPPHWLEDNLVLEGVTGSSAYGCNIEADPDEDLVGIVIPPKSVVFPHLEGYIPHFGTPPTNFENFQRHHVVFNETKKQYDLCIYSIVKLFHLCLGNNPNMLELLFLPQRCIRHSTLIYEKIRTNRRLFLHRGCYHKFRGYAYSQLSKLDKEGEHRSEKRKETVRKHGYDTKFAYHIVRLMLECEQLFIDQKIVLDKDRELFKSIRRGEWTKEKLISWFEEKEAQLERLYHAPQEEVSLPHEPDEDALRDLLLECLEDHYGNLGKAVHRPDDLGRLLFDLKEVFHKYDKPTN